MGKLFIEATKSTPLIDFDDAERKLTVKGESYPEYAGKFYAPVYEWLNAYVSTLGENDRTTVDFEITYFNSSSSKAIMNILDILEEAAATGSEIIVNWRYHKDNEAAEECGEEFMEDIQEVKFNMVKI